MQDKVNQDIVVLDENQSGNDYVIGDVHGSMQCFAQVLSLIGPKDRLFIVGDLTDRGPDSLGVMDLVLERKNQIIATRGNHEEQCLSTINYMEQLASKLIPDFIDNLCKIIDDLPLLEEALCKEEIETLYDKIIWHASRNKKWLVKLFKLELESGKITIEQNKLYYSKESILGPIKEYMSKLPYIIKVLGTNPYKIVHADMPFEDNELEKRINNSANLSEEEKDYSVWARGTTDFGNNGIRALRSKGRNSKSIRTYVGHDMLFKNTDLIIRYDSNTVNLDVGAFQTNALLLLNHTQGTSQLIGEPIIGKELLMRKKAELDTYLCLQAPKAPEKNTSLETRDKRTNEDVNVATVKKQRLIADTDPNLAFFKPIIPIDLSKDYDNNNNQLNN